MAHSLRAATLFAALFLLTACASDNDNIRFIQSGGPVYSVQSRGAAVVKPVALAAGRGPLVLEGGGTYLDAATDLTVAYAGPKPVLCLIDTAADGEGDPYDRFDSYSGIEMLTLNITPDTADDPKVIEALDRCTGYYFNGGSPELLSKGLLLNGQTDSHALAVIRRRHEAAGAAISGTSAGAMIAGPVTLCECSSKSSIVALTDGRLYRAPAYHFIDGVLIDAHFFTRGLIGRNLYALALTGERTSVGIDETTAVVVPGDGSPWQVIGSSSVAFIQRGPTATTGNLRGFTISLLNSGDRFDPLSGPVAIAEGRKQKPVALDPSAGPLKAGGVFEPDSMRQLIDSFVAARNPVAQGYAEADGLVIILRKRPDTAVYTDGNSTSVLNLDIEVARF
jgi:cyanophycinase